MGYKFSKFKFPNWILIKLLAKINEGIYQELFADGRLCFYNQVIYYLSIKLLFIS